MTVSTTDLRQPYTGNGVKTTPYDFTFKVFAASDIQVYVGGVLQTLTTHYTVSLNSVGDGGTVSFVTAPANGADILIIRALTLTQGTSLPVEGQLPAKNIEKMADKNTMLIQQLEEEIGRSVKRSTTSTSTADLTLPEPSARKGLVWNATEDGLENTTYDPDTSVADAAASAAAAASSEAAANVSASLAAGHESAASIDADNAAASAAAAAASAAALTYATITETLTGTATNRIVSPDDLASLWEKGADIASASPLVVPNTGGGYFFVTGTTGFSRIDQATAPKTGREVEFKFAGALLLTNGATLILPGGANITTAAGDVAAFRCEDTSAGAQIWRCTKYVKANGTAVVASTTAFSAYAESSNITITAGGSWSFSAGLGLNVKAYQLFLKNTTTELNYAVGDMVGVTGDNAYSTTNLGAGAYIAASTPTGVFGRFGSAAGSFEISDASAATKSAITNSKWAFVVRAWA